MPRHEIEKMLRAVSLRFQVFGNGVRDDAGIFIRDLDIATPEQDALIRRLHKELPRFTVDTSDKGDTMIFLTREG